MAVLIAPEIGIFEAVFKGFEATKNTDYCFFKWAIRNRANVLVERKDVVKASDVSELLDLQIGKNYNFEVEVTVQQPQVEPNGKTYPARIQYRPLRVLDL